MADKSFIAVNGLSEDLVVENKVFEEEDDLIVFSVVSCFMRCDLNRIKLMVGKITCIVKCG